MRRSTKVPIRFRASFRTHTGITHYEETYFIHPHPGVVHNFPMAVGAHVYDFVSLCKKKKKKIPHIPMRKEHGQTREFWSLVSTIDGSIHYLQDPGGGGGGGALTLWAWVPTAKLQPPPPFWPLTAPVLQLPNLQPHLFMEGQGQPLEINIEWWIFCIKYIIFYHTIVSRGFKNKVECIQ